MEKKQLVNFHFGSWLYFPLKMNEGKLLGYLKVTNAKTIFLKCA